MISSACPIVSLGSMVEGFSVITSATFIACLSLLIMPPTFFAPSGFDGISDREQKTCLYTALINAAKFSWAVSEFRTFAIWPRRFFAFMGIGGWAKSQRCKTHSLPMKILLRL